MKHNTKLQKDNEKLRKLNIFYQKKNMRCTCNQIPPTPQPNTTITSEPAATTGLSTVSAQSSFENNPADEIRLTHTQIALLERNVRPKFKDGALVGDLAVMLFSMNDLKTLDQNKVTWMIGK